MSAPADDVPPRRLRTRAKQMRVPASPPGPVAGRRASVATIPPGDPATPASARDIAGGELSTGAGAVERVVHRRDDVPLGCVRQAEFARRVGCAKSAVTRWIRAGMPTQGAFLNWDAAKGWYDDAPESAATRRKRGAGLTWVAYGKRIGYSLSNVQRMVQEGLPLNEHGKIDPACAGAWVKRYRRAKGRHRDDKGLTWAVPPEPKAAQEDPAETVVGVVTRLGLNCRRQAAISAGMPRRSDGRVDGARLDAWLATCPRSPKRAVLPSHLPFASFCHLIGWWARGNSKVALLRRGLPHEANGLVPVARALAWARERHLIKSTWRGKLAGGRKDGRG